MKRIIAAVMGGILVAGCATVPSEISERIDRQDAYLERLRSDCARAINGQYAYMTHALAMQRAWMRELKNGIMLDLVTKGIDDE